MSVFKLVRLSLLFTFMILFSAQAKAGIEKSNVSWPRLIAKSKSPECEQVFQVAKIVFNSTSPELDELSESVDKGKLGFILVPAGVDVDFNLSFWIDSNYIEIKEKLNNGVRKLYWQKIPVAGGRFMVAQKPMNWQGDWYDLCFVDASVQPDKFASLVSSFDQCGQCRLVENKRVSIVYHDLWHPPWLFHNLKTNQTLAVNTKDNWGTDHEKFFPDWAVYAPAGGSRIKRICTISFAPTERAVDLLPKGPLREMALLLDKIIGIPKEDEGTFHATPRLRGEAELAWGNLMLRPWAMGVPKNSREDVDKGLKKWAKGSPIYRQQYTQLLKLYPRALQSLTVYYQRYFNQSFKNARQLASISLDTAYRSNFKF